QIALHLSTQLTPSNWVVEPREASPRPNSTLQLPGGAVARLVRPHRGSARLWVAELNLPAPPHAYLRTWGRPITYSYLDAEWPIEAYQTVYASRPGSAEMPSAGRPFSGRVLDALSARGVALEAITLHTGVASLEADEPPYEEWFKVSERTARGIRTARTRGARVVAVGTTVVRALESALDSSGVVSAASGWTDLVITPERGVRSIDGLLTGFHEPR